MSDPIALAFLFGCYLPLGVFMIVGSPFLACREYRRHLGWSPRSRRGALVRAVLGALAVELLGIGVVLFVVSVQVDLPAAGAWLPALLAWLVPGVLIASLLLYGAARVLEQLELHERRRQQRYASSLMAPDDDGGWSRCAVKLRVRVTEGACYISSV
ncbi:MAG TPA: hypothetical protein VGP82_14320 [Ktedonobacterales bacterium]|jgi:hypothetical protein|nr:hypothetical protein [Ktedonobacterales bacterium]